MFDEPKLTEDNCERIDKMIEEIFEKAGISYDQVRAAKFREALLDYAQNKGLLEEIRQLARYR